MRVISGAFRGLKLNTFKGDAIRPTADRIKESLFNILSTRIAGARVLDLFAGSGSLGIECLSRGAAHVDFNDASPQSVRLLRSNLSKLKGELSFSVTAGDYSSLLMRACTPYDVIFIDPPYARQGGAADDSFALAARPRRRRRIRARQGVFGGYPRACGVRRAQVRHNLSYILCKRGGYMKKCIFAGTFDPPTVGHEDVVLKCAKLFDEVVVAVLTNPQKQWLFTRAQRVALLKKLFERQKNVRVRTFDGAAVDLLREEDTVFYVRGVRDTIDFEYENRNNYASKRLMPELITLYIPCEQSHLHVSSTLVKNSIKFKKEYADLIPASILQDVSALLEERNV